MSGPIISNQCPNTMRPDTLLHAAALLVPLPFTVYWRIRRGRCCPYSRVTSREPACGIRLPGMQRASNAPFIAPPIIREPSVSAPLPYPALVLESLACLQTHEGIYTCCPRPLSGLFYQALPACSRIHVALMPRPTLSCALGIPSAYTYAC